MINDKLWTSDSHNILEQASNLDNYNHWLVEKFKPYFGKKILEIGSGLGGISKLLPQNDLTLSDLRSDYFKFLKKQFNCNTVKLDIENESPKELIEKFDTIFSSNVFEHIKDDQEAFNNCYKLLKPGGKLLLYVPARQEIFGKLDEDMGHYRRYTVEEGIKKAKKAGFKIIADNYSNLPGYFTWWGRGVLISKLIKSDSGKSGSDSFLAKIFDLFVVPLLWLEKFYQPPFGQSLFLVAEKV